MLIVVLSRRKMRRRKSMSVAFLSPSSGGVSRFIGTGEATAGLSSEGVLRTDRSVGALHPDAVLSLQMKSSLTRGRDEARGIPCCHAGLDPASIARRKRILMRV